MIVGVDKHVGYKHIFYIYLPLITETSKTFYTKSFRGIRPSLNVGNLSYALDSFEVPRPSETLSFQSPPEIKFI